MEKFSEMAKKATAEGTDYAPIIDSSASEKSEMNKTITMEALKQFLLSEILPAEEERVKAEQERIEAEKIREDKETGYVAQARSWAVGDASTSEMGASDNNARYWAEQSNQSANASADSERRSAEIYENLASYGLSVVDGAISLTYTE